LLKFTVVSQFGVRRGRRQTETLSALLKLGQLYKIL
jgi:hypothetical protein